MRTRELSLGSDCGKVIEEAVFREFLNDGENFPMKRGEKAGGWR